jgi:hypothetical protein
LTKCTDRYILVHITYLLTPNDHIYQWDGVSAWIDDTPTSGEATLVTDSSAWYLFTTLWTKQSTPSSWVTSGANMFNTNTGNVGIGSGTSGSPNNKLLVQGGNIAKGTTFGYDGTVDNMIKYGAQQDINVSSGQQLDRWIGIDATVTAGAGSSNIMFFKVYSGGGSGSPRTAAFFNGDGGVYNFNNSTTWQQTSDIRIKDNIRPINDAIEKLCALKPSHFEYKNNLGKTKTGFIAQEFEEVFAGHVTENVPSGEFKQYFEEGEMMKSIDADLIPYLVKAIQEQQALITALEEKLERNNII